jgi:23S rRNA pseudouridine2457 synthase
MPQPSCGYLYIAFYKPYNVLSDFDDPEGRATLRDYLPEKGLHVAGRLDYDSEGLLLLTDDGALSHRLTHPRYEHPKTYLVQVEGIPGEEALQALREGVSVKGRTTLPAEVTLLERDPDIPLRSALVQTASKAGTSWLRITLREGRKRQIRHMTAAVGHPTLRLVRAQVGPIGLGALQPGAWRALTPEECGALRNLALLGPASGGGQQR